MTPGTKRRGFICARQVVPEPDELVPLSRPWFPQSLCSQAGLFSSSEAGGDLPKITDKVGLGKAAAARWNILAGNPSQTTDRRFSWMTDFLLAKPSYFTSLHETLSKQTS